MAGNFETLHHNTTAAADAGSIGTILHNEAYVLGSGLAGSLKEVKQAAEDAWAHPGSTALKVGTSLAIAGVLGFCARRAGLAGLLARGAVTALGVNLALDAVSPIGHAIGDAYSARSWRDLDAASGRLASGLGRFEFDTLITLPFAMGMSVLGRGVGKVMAESSRTAETASASSTARSTHSAETGRTGPSQGRARLQSTSSDYAGQTRRTAAGGFTGNRSSRRVVLEGELVEPEVTSFKFSRRTEPEIIDAEFTVVEESVPLRRQALPHSRKALPDTRSQLPARPMASEASSNLPVRREEQAIAEARPLYATPASRNQELSPAQIKKALKAYTDTTPEPGRILDVRI